MASVKDLTSFGIRLETCRRISEEDFEKLARQGCQPYKGDVLIAKDGATALDTVCEVKRNEDVVLLSSVAILRPNLSLIHSGYLHYYLDASTTRSYLKGSFISGAAIPRVVLKDLKRAVVRVPPLTTQRRIAGILSAYDDLIENNQRRIKILEEMARSLYREWFVHFRFPGHDKVNMVPSSLGPIPQGWEVKSLAALMEIRGGSQPPKSDFIYEEQPGYVRLIQIRDYEKDSHLTFVRESSNLRLCNRTDIMIARYGASVARICWGLTGAYNVALIKVIPLSTNCQEFLRQFLSDEEFQKLLIGMSGRAAQNGFNKSDIAAIRVAFTNDHSLLERLEQFAVPLRDTTLLLRDQTKNLRRTRDLLLPRLLSGQVHLT